MRKWLFYFSILALCLAAGCANQKKEQKVEMADINTVFKKLHKTIYKGWETDKEGSLKKVLKSCTTGKFYQEQLQSQLAQMEARKEANEKHKVTKITYHEFRVVKETKKEAVIYTDYTIEGYRYHGDYHQQKSSHRLYWHLVHTDNGWRIDEVKT